MVSFPSPPSLKHTCSSCALTSPHTASLQPFPCSVLARWDLPPGGTGHNKAARFLAPLEACPLLLRKVRGGDWGSRPPKVGLEQLDPTNEASLRPGPSWAAAASCPHGQGQRKPSSQGCLFWAPCPGQGSQSPEPTLGGSEHLGIMGDWAFLKPVAQPGPWPAVCEQEVSGACLGTWLHEAGPVRG